VGGILGGVIGTLLGTRGGLILTLFLVLVLHVPMHEAIATSIIAVIATSPGGAVGNCEWGIAAAAIAAEGDRRFVFVSVLVFAMLFGQLIYSLS
jgi:uncharacterized membrane protein YfcA